MSRWGASSSRQCKVDPSLALQAQNEIEPFSFRYDFMYNHKMTSFEAYAIARLNPVLEGLGYKQTSKRGFKRPKGASGIQLAINLNRSRRYSITEFRPTFHLLCREVAAHRFAVIQSDYADADPKLVGDSPAILSMNLGHDLHDESRRFTRLSWINETDDLDDRGTWFELFPKRVAELTDRYRHLELDFYALEAAYADVVRRRPDLEIELKAFRMAAELRSESKEP